MLLIERMKLPNDKVVSLELKNNQGYLLQGENGAGKSLLLKSLAYLLPTSFDKFTFDGEDVQTLQPEYYRSQALYCGSQASTFGDELTEDFLNLPFTFSIYKNLVPQIEVKFWLNKWGLEKKSVLKLSSGQRQLLSFLRLMSLNGKILFLDETFSHLDTSKVSEVLELLKDWQTRTQGSFVIVSHQEGQLEGLSLERIRPLI